MFVFHIIYPVSLQPGDSIQHRHTCKHTRGQLSGDEQLFGSQKTNSLWSRSEMHRKYPIGATFIIFRVQSYVPHSYL